MSVKIRIWWCTGENGHNSHSLLSKLLPCLAPKHPPTDTESYLHIQNITREFRMLFSWPCAQQCMKVHPHGIWQGDRHGNRVGEGVGEERGERRAWDTLGHLSLLVTSKRNCDGAAWDNLNHLTPFLLWQPVCTCTYYTYGRMWDMFEKDCANTFGYWSINKWMITHPSKDL